LRPTGIKYLLLEKWYSDEFILSASEKDDIEDQLSSELLKCCRWCEKLKFRRFWGRWKKSTVRVFLDQILSKMIKKWLIGIYGKTAPTKSTVLGPGPPPGILHKIYRFLPFFWFFRPAFEPHKSSPKSASTPYPPAEDPQKWKKVKF
jgi:hypothetical protein